MTVKISSVHTIVSAGDNNLGDEYLSFHVGAGQLRVKIRDAAATKFEVRGPTNIELNKWQHVAVVHDGVRPYLYVNGKAVAMTDTTAVDLTLWYADLAGVDKCALGVLESNATHTNDFEGGIGPVKYWNRKLTPAEILLDYHGDAQTDDATYLQFNITMDSDGTTDSGLGADNGTLTGNAKYAGLISTYSRALEKNVTGHAAEVLNSFIIGDKIQTIIKRGD